MPSIFTRIINGEIPCHRVYEDDHVIAFLDIGPVSRGHVLVVPKEESVRLDSIGAVSTRLAYVCRSGSPDDVITSEDCPEAERLSNP